LEQEKSKERKRVREWIDGGGLHGVFIGRKNREREGGEY
jgi:predicted AlkP superfamily phosphohydrolase/phosphomutase